MWPNLTYNFYLYGSNELLKLNRLLNWTHEGAMLMWSNELLIGAESNILQYLITRPNKQLSTEVVMNAVMCSTVLNFVVNAPGHYFLTCCT
jgi:hypothetical protein